MGIVVAIARIDVIIAFAGAGVVDIVEIGSGKVLAGLAKRIDKRLSAQAIGTAEAVKAFAASRQPG